MIICTVIAIAIGGVRGPISHRCRSDSVASAPISPASGAMGFRCNGYINECKKITPVGSVEAEYK